MSTSWQVEEERLNKWQILSFVAPTKTDTTISLVAGLFESRMGLLGCEPTTLNSIIPAGLPKFWLASSGARAEAMRTAVFWPWIEDEVDQSSAILARIIDGEDELIGEFINLVAGLFCRRSRIVKWGWASTSTSLRHKTLKGTFVLWPAWARSFYWGCLI